MTNPRQNFSIAVGTCRSYFDATLQKLRELGIQDRKMEQLQALLYST
jgi:cation transport regulator ChaC